MQSGQEQTKIAISASGLGLSVLQDTGGPERLLKTSRVPVVLPGNRSDLLVQTDAPVGIEPRDCYLQNPADLPLPWISSSDFIQAEQVEHLMLKKRDTAIGIKWEYKPTAKASDQITNAQGALHTFVNPLVLSWIHGDHRWNYGHDMCMLGSHEGKQLARPVIISAAIHQDFEFEGVMTKICEPRRSKPDLASQLNTMSLPMPGSFTMDKKRIQMYDEELAQAIQLRLLRLQDNTKWFSRLELEGPEANENVLDRLEAAITSTESSSGLEEAVSGKILVIPRRRSHLLLKLSLELLFLVALHQVRNELAALDHVCPMGYNYTYDPPQIFRQALGTHGQRIMMLVHAAALKQYTGSHDRPLMKVFAYNDFGSPTAMTVIKAALKQWPQVQVMPKTELFKGEGGTYMPPAGAERCMLVIHNNSDGFGQNIESEQGNGSLDAVIGRFSSAAASIKRDRKDLLCESRMMFHGDESLGLAWSSD